MAAMIPARDGGLLAWQLRNYPGTHRDRRNLAIHAATAPLFLAGTCALPLSFLAGPALLAFAAGALALPLVLQGRGPRLEAQRPSPFLGPADFVRRLFAEQWVTFPRYVLGGGFSRAWHEAGPAARRERPA
jgi:hypothetical protein